MTDRDKKRALADDAPGARPDRSTTPPTRSNEDLRYTARSAGLVVEVEPMFLESQSFPELSHFVWAYRVTIHNQRDDTVQLQDRYWRLTDKTGSVREVRGEGVVGERPVIEPGSSFVYTSAAPLPTPSGVMEGEYGMRASDGGRFKARIPPFSLDSPHDSRVLN